jgi:protein SFI1
MDNCKCCIRLKVQCTHGIPQTTYAQVSHARDTIVFHDKWGRWKTRTIDNRQLLERVSLLSDARLLRAVLHTWNARMMNRRRAATQHAMQVKLSDFRTIREQRILKDAWSKWRQSYQSHLVQQQYQERLVLQVYRRWKDRILGCRDMETRAVQYSTGKAWRLAGALWCHWSAKTPIAYAERIATEKRGTRIVRHALTIWYRQLCVAVSEILSRLIISWYRLNVRHNEETAQKYSISILKTRMLKSWKTATDRIKVMHNRDTDKEIPLISAS